MLRDRLATTLSPLSQRLVPLAERFDRMSLRERGLIFGASLVVTFMAWQVLLMDPLAVRAAAAEQRLAEAHQRAEAAGLAGAAAVQDPTLLAVTREHALREQRAALEQQLIDASRGYVPPNRMAEVLKDLLANQHGLRLIAMRNLPAESLAAEGKAAPAGAEAVQPDRGPYAHPVEIELEGDYASVVGYLRSLEKLPLRLSWRELALTAQKYPVNRVRIEIATLSLSRDWMSV